MDLTLNFLIFPKNSPIWCAAGLDKACAVERRIPILLLPSLAHDSEEVLIFKSGRLLTGAEFQSLRESSWVRIETEEPCRVMRALNLPAGEFGIQPMPVRPRSDT